MHIFNKKIYSVSTNKIAVEKLRKSEPIDLTRN